MGLLTSKIASFGNYTLYSDEIKSSAKHGGKYPLTGVTARLEAGEALESRVTATRLVAIGVFAFAAKKKKGGTWYLTIEGPEFFWTAEVERKKQDDARTFAARVNDAAKGLAARVEQERLRQERKEARAAKKAAKAAAKS